MSLITTCPACGTSFRITLEQLSAHRGDVRCGQCQHIFSALKQLAEVAASHPAAPQRDSFPPQVEDAPIFEEAATIPRPETAEPVEAELAAMLEPAADAASPEAETDVAALHFEILDPENPDIELEPPTVETAEEVAQSPIAVAVAEPSPASEPPADETIAALPEPEPAAEPSAPPPTSPPAVRPAQRSSSRLLAPLALLLGLAAGQAVYFLRTEIAAHFPQTMPWLITACDRLHCTVELPRQADLLSIEDSDLQDDPEHAGALVLVSSLYNRAPYAQAYPLLELTLTDTFDKPVLRRTLAPLEYLPENTGLTAGIPAGGEINVRLNLGVTGTKPAGYRLYVKY